MKRGAKKASPQRRASARLAASSAHTKAESTAVDPSSPEPEPPAKRRKTATTTKNTKNDSNALHGRLFGGVPSTDLTVAVAEDAAAAAAAAAIISNKWRKAHDITYHRPLLLYSGPSAKAGREALLSWFDSVSTARKMPWRKAWVDPSSYPSDGNLSEEEEEQLRSVLRKRAYEVWISEIMLQQTRVAVVIGYWERWMERWPTVDALAAAAEDDVRSAWQGLGYYSRATRIHEAAKLVCNDPVLRGLLPATAEELEKKVPGVGRYTAGAISAIVFGRAAAMVDGNVLRVLSRQLGILGDVKTDKKVIDTLWAAADALVKAVAWGNDERREEGEPPLSDRPGRWGQALMELGSTVCTPKPNCSACPVTDTCRAYAEGHALATEAGLVGSSKKQLPAAPDIEELCGLCEYFEDVVELDDEEDGTVTLADNPPAKPKPVKDTKQSKLSSFFFTPTTRSSKGGDEEVTPATKPSLEAMEVIASHARKFPVRKPKKKVREEETVVCAIRRESLLEPLEYEYIIHRRPEKGLLAGMWELPSHVLPESNDSTPKSRKSAAISYASGLVRGNDLKYVGKLGSVPWLFSHLKLTMHVYLFEIVGYQQGNWDGKDARWADTEKINLENMGTGMKKCWELVRRSRDSDYNSES